MSDFNPADIWDRSFGTGGGGADNSPPPPDRNDYRPPGNDTPGGIWDRSFGGPEPGPSPDLPGSYGGYSAPGSPFEGMTFQSYWENPEAIAMHYVGMKAGEGTDVDWAALGIDPDFVSAAYNHMAEVNGNTEWWTWKPLEEGDAFLDLMRGMTAPNEDAQWGAPGFTWDDFFGDLTPPWMTGDQAQPTQPPPPGMVVPTADQWNNLQGWQKLAYSAMQQQGAVAGAVQMLPWAVAGAAAGSMAGPLGALVGFVAPLGFGAVAGFAGDPAIYDRLRKQYGEQEWIDNLQGTANGALTALNYLGEKTEQGFGMTAFALQPLADAVKRDVIAADGDGLQFSEAILALEQGLGDVLNNWQATAEASKLTYESLAPTVLGTALGNVLPGLEFLAETLTNVDGGADVQFAKVGEVWDLGRRDPRKLDVTGVAMMEMARQRILRSTSPDDVAAVIRDFQNLAGFTGQLTDMTMQSIYDPLNLVPGLEKGMIGRYANLTGNLALEMAVKNADAFGEGARGVYSAYSDILKTNPWKYATLPGGQKVEVPMVPAEYSAFQRRVAGVVEAAPGVYTMADYTPGVRAARGLLNFAENPWNPLAWVQGWQQLTPESKVKGVQSLAWENASALTSAMQSDPAQLVKAYRAWAQLPPTQAAEVARMLGMPEAGTVRQFMADFVGSKLNAAAATWEMGTARRRALHNLAGELGEQWTDVMRAMQGSKKGDLTADNIYARLIERQPDLAADPTFSPASLGELVDYFRDQPWAAHPEYFAAHLKNLLMDHVTERSIQAFGLKNSGPAQRYATSLKAVQSMVLLNLSPGYLVNNVISNMTTRLYDGIFGLRKPSAIVREFRETGIIPYRLLESGNPADTGAINLAMDRLEQGIADANKKVREAMRGHDFSQRLADATAGLSQKLALMTRLANANDAFEGANAFYTAYHKALPHILRGTIGKLDPSLSAELRSIDPALPDRLVDAVMGARTPAEVDAILSGGQDLSPRAYVDAAARQLGMEPDHVRELMEQSGVLDELETRLSRGEPLQDALTGLDEQLETYLDDIQLDELHYQAAAVRTKVEAEGLQAAFEVLHDVFARLEEAYTRHFAEWGHTWEIANAPGVTKSTRNALIRQRDQLQERSWLRTTRWVEAAYAGILRGLGIGDPDLAPTMDPAIKSFALALTDYHQNWRDFFAARRDAWKGVLAEGRRRNLAPYDATEWTALTDAARQRLARLYDQHGKAEARLTQKLGKAFEKIMAQQFGESHRKTAGNYWRALETAQARRRQVMADFRAWERGDTGAIVNQGVRQLVDGWTPDRKHALWPQFYERVYVPVIGEYIQSGFDGVARLYKDLTGETIDYRQADTAAAYAQAQMDLAPAPEPTPPSPEPAETGTAPLPEMEEEAAPELVQTVMDNILTETAPAIPDLPPTPEAEAAPALPVSFLPEDYPAMSVMELARQMQAAFPDYTEQEVMFSLALVRQRARSWARMTGQPINEYYAQKFAGVMKAGTDLLDTVTDMQGGAAPRAGIAMLEDGRALIFSFQSPDVSSLVHEVGHLFWSDLAGADLDTAADWAGATRQQDGTWLWSEKAEENFADGFVRYLEEGRAPTAKLRKVFEAFKSWLAQLFADGDELGVTLSDEMRKVYANLLNDRVSTTLNQLEGGPLTVADVHPPSLKELGWTRGPKALFDAVNADRRELYKVEPYKLMEDTPWPEALEAIARRQREAAPAHIQRATREAANQLLSDYQATYASKDERTQGMIAQRELSTGDPEAGPTMGGKRKDEIVSNNWWDMLERRGLDNRRLIENALRQIKDGGEPTGKYAEAVYGIIDQELRGELPSQSPAGNFGYLLHRGDEHGAALAARTWLIEMSSFGGDWLEFALDQLGGNRADYDRLMDLVYSLPDEPQTPTTPDNTPFQYQKKAKPGQIDMFAQGPTAFQDLPLFSGTAQQGQVSEFTPTPEDTQLALPGMEQTPPDLAGAQPATGELGDLPLFGGQPTPPSPTPPSPTQRTLFQQAAAQAQPGTLKAVHNVNADNLRHIAMLGGIPAPSIAVLKHFDDFGGYGDITLMVSRDLADPKKSGVRVFDADIYSQRHPRPEWPKVASKVAQPIIDRLRAAENFLETWGTLDSLWDYLVNRPNKPEAENILYSKAEGRLTFLQEKGLADNIEWPRYAPGGNTMGGRVISYEAATMLKKLIEKHGLTKEYRQWVTDLLDVYGDPYLKVKGKRVPYNLDNIVEAMQQRDPRGKEGSAFSEWGYTRGRGAEELRSIDDMHRVEKRLTDTAALETYTKNVQDVAVDKSLDALRDFAPSHIKDKYRRNEFGGDWDMLDLMRDGFGEYLRSTSGPSLGKMEDALFEQGVKKSYSDDPAAWQDALQQAVDAAEVIRNTPTEYFEGKFNRAVKLSEFAGAVIPDNTPEDVIKILRDANLDIHTYPDGNETRRQSLVFELVKDRPDLRFQGWAGKREGQTLPVDRRVKTADRQYRTDEQGRLRDQNDNFYNDQKQWVNEMGQRLNEQGSLYYTGTELLDWLNTVGVTSPDTVAKMLGDHFPDYLYEVSRFILEQRQKVMEGGFSRRDVAKAYVMTIASIGSDARYVGKIEAGFANNGIPLTRDGQPIDLSKFYDRIGTDGPMLRPETVAALFLYTDLGRAELDKIEAGQPIDLDVWGRFAKAKRAMFGDKVNTFAKAVTGTGPDGKAPAGKWLGEIGKVTDLLNEWKGDPAHVDEVVRSLHSIAEGKSGFIRHMLGFGENVTVDIREIRAWMGVEDPSLATALNDNSRSGKITRRMRDMIEDAFRKVRDQHGLGKDLPEETFMHVMHHWIWDAYMGSVTTQAPVIDAMRHYQSGRDVPQGGPAAVGPLLPGALDEAGAGVTPHSQVQAEAYDNYVRPLMNEMGKAMQNPEPLPMTGLSPDGRKKLKAWAARYRKELPQAQLAATRIAETHRDMALLNYNRRYNIDTAATMFAPYMFWPTRSMVNWAMRLLDKPALLATYARFAMMQQRNYQEDDLLPDRVKGKVRVPLPGLPEWMGGGLYVDPIRKMFPVMDFVRPLERLIQNQGSVDRKAYDLVRKWIETGEVTPEEGQAALTGKTGAVWDRAMTTAQGETGSDWIDYSSLFLSPALYLTVPYKLMTGQGSELGPFPPSRVLQALGAATGMQGLTGLDMEARARENAGLSAFGQWGDWYVDRQLVSLVADGAITYDQAVLASIERQGEAYDLARSRVQQEMMLQQPGALPIYMGQQFVKGEAGLSDVLGSMLLGWLPGNLVSQGELETAGLEGEYNAARQAWKMGDKTAITRFLDENPEYSARMALYDEPEERLRNFLVSETWDQYKALPELQQRRAREAFGDDFGRFLSGEGDAIPATTLAAWVRTMGGNVGSLPAPTLPVNWAPPELSGQYDQYLQERDTQFPGMDAALDYINYNVPEDQQKAMKNKLNPGRYKYYDWREDQGRSNPALGQEVTPWLYEDQAPAQQSTGWTPRLTQAVSAQPGLMTHIQAAQWGEPLTDGAIASLQYIWKREGQGVEFYTWLAGLGIALPRQ